MKQTRTEHLSSYIAEVFAKEDPQLASLMSRAVADGLPDIAVSPATGKLLSMLARMAGQGGARQAVEVGTLAGYSAIWLTRGMAPGGKLTTIELNPKHADFASREFARAGLSARIQIRRGPAIEQLSIIAKTMPQGSIDLLFLDAVKTEYSEYFKIMRPMIRNNGLVLADNVLGSSTWRMDDAAGSSADRDAVDAFNRMVASDVGFESVVVPVGYGVLVARKIAT